MVSIRTYPPAEVSPALLAGIRQLLDDAFDGDLTDDDWAHTLGGRHVVVTAGGRPAAHAAVVPRTLWVAGRPLETGYVEGVGTAPAHRGHGFGSRAMAEISRLVRAWFDMGALSTDRHAFYARLGWEPWRGATFVRHGTGTVRTADEDDGIMVLRAGPSRNVDLTADLACESRPGDDW